MMYNPYDQNVYKPKSIKINNKKKKKDFDINLNNYKFDMDISGSNGNRLLLLTTGYLGIDKNSDNYFLLDENDIDKIIKEFEKYKYIIRKGKETKELIEKLHNKLNSYIDRGYVEYISMTYKPLLIPPGFNKLIYKPFVIKPIFKENLDLPEDSDIDTGFEFLEVLHVDINEVNFDMLMDYVRGGNDIPIHIFGWNYNDELEKRKREALKDLDKETKRRKNKSLMDKESKKFEEMLTKLNGGVLSSKNVNNNNQ